MLIFPKIIYPLLNLPLLFRHKDINLLESSLLKFIWTKKNSKIALHKLKITTINRFDLFISSETWREQNYSLTQLAYRGFNLYSKNNKYSNICTKCDAPNSFNLLWECPLSKDLGRILRFI
ncbi:hypothetical protein XELAEV_18001216mg [Xenopus laevis]|nr:hypothetical protein XELAEV_18001216mg [Xenopus laevis]